MFRRPIITISLVILLVSVPAVSLADTGLNQGGSAAGLGPAANSGTSSTGSSSADSGTLQPAGTNPLQSGTGASNGLTAPSSNTLQAPASNSGSLQVLQGEADGSTHQLGETSRVWLWLVIAIVILGTLIIGALRFRRRPIAAKPIAAEAAEPIRDLKLAVIINRPAADVFHYLLDPANTPKWIDSIVAENADEQPPKLGTQYKNQNQAGVWTEYEIIGFEEPTRFTFAQIGGPYRVTYTLNPVATLESETEPPNTEKKDDAATEANDQDSEPRNNEEVSATELEYHEWVEEGELSDPFPAEALQKLKGLLEAES